MKSSEAEFKRSFIFRLGKKLRPWLNSVLAAQSEVGNPPVFEPATFPWTDLLERNWDKVRAEALAVLENRNAIPILEQISPDHRRISDGPKWRSFFLWGYGYQVPTNCARCPQTSWLMEQIPGLNSAFFSILEPGIHIRRHRGVTKRIVTCHLGLIVPKAEPAAEAGGAPRDCRMAVDDQMVRWQEGKCLVFDDTYFHEVWNDTNETRVVLLIQFKRPIRLPGRLLGDLFLAAVRRSPFVQEARRNLAAWDTAHKKAEQE